MHVEHDWLYVLVRTVNGVDMTHWITEPGQLHPFTPGWYGMERTDDWKPIRDTRWVTHFGKPDILENLIEDGKVRCFGPIQWPED